MNRRQPFLTNGDSVGFELVGGDVRRRITLLLQQLSQQSPRRLSAASWLDKEVQNFTFVVDRPPQPMSPAADPDDHLVEVPARTGARTATTEIARNQPPELQQPKSNRLVRNIDATLGQQILDITKRKRVPGLEPYSMLDDLGRKAMTLE